MQVVINPSASYQGSKIGENFRNDPGLWPTSFIVSLLLDDTICFDTWTDSSPIVRLGFLLTEPRKIGVYHHVIMGKIHQLFRRSTVVALGGWEIVVISISQQKGPFLVGGWKPPLRKKYATVKMGSSSVMFGVKIPKIFELPPTRFMFGGSVFKQKDPFCCWNPFC